MDRGSIPRDERERLTEVRRLEKAADEKTPYLDDLTRQAARFFHVPIAIITLVDQDRVWVKSHFGIDVTQVKRENSLCDLAIRERDLLIIPDTRKHPLASNCLMVTSPPGIRFYAAAPLRSRFGYNVGTLCIMDVHPRTLSEQDQFVLRLLGEVAAKEIESRAASSREVDVSRETSFGELFAGGPTIIFKWRAAEGWPVEYVSPNVSQLGYTPEDFLTGGLPYAQVVHPEDLERVAREVETYSRRGDDFFTQEYRVIRKGGQTRWVFDYTTVVRDESGAITHYLGYILDITTQKEAEIALRDSWAKYEAAVEGFDGFVYLCSSDHKIEFMNQRLLEQIGSQKIGQECFRAVFGRKTPCPCCAGGALQQNQTVHWEGFSNRDKRWYHVAITPWYRADGSVSRLAMAYDITPRKESEAATLRREAILSGVAQVADILLRTPEWRRTMPTVLALLGQAAESDRAFLVENERMPDGRILGTMNAEWTAPGIPPRIYAPISHSLPYYEEPGFRAWAECLQAGRTLEALIQDIPEPQQSQLKEHGIRSLVALPIFVGQEWWGFLGFDFCGREKRCTPIELDALRTAASLLGNVLMRHRSEAALQKSDTQQRILLKAIPDLMFRLRSDGTFLDYKAERDSDLAVAPERIIGNKIQALLPASISSLTLSYIKTALQTNRPQVYEYNLNIRGTSRRFEARLVVSGPDEVLAIVREITEQYHNQLLLKTLWSAIEQTPDIVYITDARGRFIYVNKATERTTGYAAEELLGQSPAILKSGIHSTEFYRQLWQDLMSGKTVHVEFINKKKDGSYYTQETTLIPIIGADQQIANFVAVGRDVTERHRSEAAIRKLAAFPEVNPNAVIELNADGLVQYRNPAALDMVKEYGCSEVIELLPINYVEVVRQCIASMTVRRRIEKQLGQHTLSWSFFPIADTHTVHAYGTDITDRLAMETQLRHLQKMEAVGRLAGGLAHDFNNILTAIMGYASMLQASESLPSSVREQVHEISNAAERAAHLTRQLLAFSRRQVMQRIPVSINATLERLGGMLRRLIHENITLTFSFAENLPQVSADPTMLEQVFTNMVINARDAMPNGGTIRIATSLKVWASHEIRHHHPGAMEGPTVCIEITDEGCGMTEEVKSRLFEPFFTTKEKGHGTGLGLATAYGIIRQHEGWIDVESVPGAGSTFRVYLPVRESAPVSVELPTVTPQRRGQETLLLVEDEDRVRTLAATVLTAAGYVVLQAGTGREALDTWQKHRDTIDLLITDVVMPGGISGTELAERMRAEKSTLKIVFISGYGKDSSVIRLPTEYHHVFLPKPFAPHELMHVVAHALGTNA